MDRMRREEKAAFKKQKPEHESAIKAVQVAKDVLRDYYAKAKSTEPDGSESGNIIGMLEMLESDFSKQLSNMISEEESAQATYEEATAGAGAGHPARRAGPAPQQLLVAAGGLGWQAAASRWQRAAAAGSLRPSTLSAAALP